MKLILKATLIASALAILPLSAAVPASARAAVSFNFGNIAVGYRDGYWDNGHRWHRWSNHRDAVHYRAHYQGNYHNTYHYRAHNNGWER